MKTVRALRIAAGVALVQYAAHAFLFLTAHPKHGAEEIALLEAMRSHAFDFSGSARSYWTMYFGYGLMAIVAGIVEVVALWLIAGLAKSDPKQVVPLVYLFLFADLAHCALAATHFFMAPVVADVVVGALLAWALVAARSQAVRVLGFGIERDLPLAEMRAHSRRDRRA
jgi:hypothetical protein